MKKKIRINREFLANLGWAHRQWAKLTRQYQGKWIAVFHDQVIASDKAISSVEKRVRRLTKKKPFEDIPLLYIEDPHCIFQRRQSFVIHLTFRTSDYEIPGSSEKIEIVRLEALIGLRKKKGEDYLFLNGIVDTGAYISLIPKRISEEIERTVFGEDKMKGINSKETCSIPVEVGKTRCILLDQFGNVTPEKEMLCYFADTDEVPVIIGFVDLLTEMTLTVNYKAKKAHLS